MVCAMQNVFWTLNYSLPWSMKFKRNLETLKLLRQPYWSSEHIAANHYNSLW